MANQILVHAYSTNVGTGAYVELQLNSVSLINTSKLLVTDTSGKIVKLAVATPITPTAAVAATLVNQTVTYAADVAGTSGNAISVELLNPGSQNQALAVNVTGKKVSVSLASGPDTAAVGTLDLTVDVVLTSVAKGTARNTNTFTTQVLAAAANPTNTVIVAFTGTAAAITCTITPNDGTNNGAVPVNFTTANLTELINTGLVAGKNITLTDASSRRILQTATGGGPQNMVDSGQGDGTVATFAGGLAYVLTSTAAQVVAAVNLSAPASALVDASTSAGGTVLAALSETSLAGGSAGGAAYTSPTDLFQNPVDSSMVLPLPSTATIPIGSRFYLRAIDATANSGNCVVTLLS